MRQLYAGLLVFCLCLTLSCVQKQTQRADFVLGTICSIRFFKELKPELFDELFSRLYELDDIFNMNKDNSDIDRINKNAGIQAVPVKKECIELLSRALYFSEISSQSNGYAAFDPTIGPLVKLWGIGSDKPRIPSPDEIKEKLSLINWRNIEINQEEQTVFLTKKGMSLDLGAIAKGYAADIIAEKIREYGIESAVIDLGGNIFALGEKPDKNPYKIGIQNPLSPRGDYMVYVETKNKTLVTSGSYERFFEENGVRYHHILSTETGYPVDNGLLSVTIIAENSTDADALSTTIYALGFEKGSALLKTMSGIDAIFIFEDGSLRVTEGAEKILGKKAKGS
ncbi:MAG: FAD:protein FMN transferase [Spirochaetaceae bacterium]|nr:FAD:protein FMN transferase [Spirochaetaceae bacterium]